MKDHHKCCWHRRDAHDDHFCEQHYSMRRFLEDPKHFEWPDNEQRQNLHYTFSADHGIREYLTWERPLTRTWFREDYRKSRSVYKVPSAVHQLRAIETKRDQVFKHSFADKRLNCDAEGTEKVLAMADLRYPHISAVLGTYWSDGCIHLLTFPAGCCDLSDFMRCISDNMKDIAWKAPTYKLQDSEPQYMWPFKMDHVAQRRMLRKYFVCLCQALAYLHSEQILVRHKDIKPENIVIDMYGNVILTDFDFSTRFSEKNKQMITRDPSTKTTPKYAPPERSTDKDRDMRSDVWSLGCVFLEMVSLVLGYTLDECQQNCSKPLSRNAKSDNYCDNIKAIGVWLETLATPEPKREPLPIITKTLPRITSMLNAVKEGRPDSCDLWDAFDFPDQGACPDCHPGKVNDTYRWQATDEQKARNKDGLIRRATLEKKSDDIITEQDEGQTSEDESQTFVSVRPGSPGSPRQIPPSSKVLLDMPSGNTITSRRPSVTSNLTRQHSRETGVVDRSMTNKPAPGPTSMKSAIAMTRRMSPSPERKTVSFDPMPVRDTRLSTLNPGARGSTTAAQESIDPALVGPIPTDAVSDVGPAMTTVHESASARTGDAKQDNLKPVEPSSPNMTDREPEKPRPASPTLEKKGGIAKITESFAIRIQKRPTPPSTPPHDAFVVTHHPEAGFLLRPFNDQTKDQARIHFKLPSKGRRFAIQVSGTTHIVLDYNYIQKHWGPYANPARDWGLWLLWPQPGNDSVLLEDTETLKIIQPTFL